MKCGECRYFVPSPGWRYASTPEYAETLKSYGQCAVTLPEDDKDPETDARKVVRFFTPSCERFQRREDV